MPTEVVLDSTAVSVLFFRDPYSQRVESAIHKFDRFRTLDLVFSEVGNVAWKRIQIFKEDYATILQVLSVAADFVTNVCLIVESRNILAKALEFGVKHKLPIYGSLFLVLARDSRTKLLTTDEKLHRTVSKIDELKTLTLLP